MRYLTLLLVVACVHTAPGAGGTVPHVSYLIDTASVDYRAPSTSAPSLTLTGGDLTLTTPGDINLGASSELVLGNVTTSRVRGGGGTMGLNDAIGATLAYTGVTLTLDGQASLAMTAGRFSVSGDATSPALPALRLVPQDTLPTGPNVVGDMYMTTAGVLRICTVAGSPGTWTSVTAI